MTTNDHSSSSQRCTKQNLAISANTVSRLAEMVSHTIGFDMKRIGESSIIRAAQKVQAYSNKSTHGSLEDLFLHDPMCRQLFIESIVVPESWLFREPKVFQYINTSLRQRLKNQSEVKILSAPCATGEEACSIALSLLDSSHSRRQFYIIATDISQRAIEDANSGIYPEKAFRSIDETRKKKWFSSTPTGWQVSPKIQETIRFLNRNLLDAQTETDLLHKANGRFDLICCRNLLVYFTKPQRENLLKTIRRLLKPDGELVVGAAEAVILSTGTWEPTGPLTFRIRKQVDKSRPTQQEKIQRTNNRNLLHTQVGFNQPEHDNPKIYSNKTTTSAAVACSEVIQDVEALANAGEIEDAIRLCQKSLQINGAQTDLLYMLAILHQTSGNYVASEKLLEKAVYLEPRHEGALLALALIAKRRGDMIAERRYRRSASLGGMHS